MIDPALDHPGQRLDDHLAASIEVLKATDTGPVPHAVIDTKGEAATNPIVVPLPEPPAVALPLGANAIIERITGLDQIKAAAPPAKPPTPKPAGVDMVALAMKKVAAAKANMLTRATRLADRAELFSKQIDNSFDNQESSLAQGEQVMDALDASLASVGNEDPNA